MTLLLALLVFAAGIIYKIFYSITNQGVRITIWLMAVVDVVILTSAVIQQGGLSKSVFVPMYFLIPTVVILLEHDDLRDMTPFSVWLWIALLIVPIVMALYFTSTVSTYQLKEFAALGIGLKVLSLGGVVQPKSLERALVVVSSYSLLVPILEIKMIRTYYKRTAAISARGNVAGS